jgi:hypothetical protein
VSAVKKDKPGHFFWAMVCAGLATLTKFNGVSLFLVIGVVALIKYWRERETLKKIGRAGLLVVLISVPLAIGNNFYCGWSKDKNPHVIGNIDEFGRIYPFRVNNDLKNFYTLDLGAFLRKPFMTPWNDSTGRKYYWNYFLKTSLFESYEFERPMAIHLGKAMSLLLLVLCSYSLVGLMVERKKKWDILQIALLATVITLLVPSLLLRYMNPYCSVSDFRYVMPILIPACLFFVRAIGAFEERNWLFAEYFGFISGALFVFSSVAFMFVLY